MSKYRHASLVVPYSRYDAFTEKLVGIFLLGFFGGLIYIFIQTLGIRY